MWSENQKNGKSIAYKHNITYITVLLTGIMEKAIMKIHCCH